MLTELLLAATALTNLALVTLCARLAPERLYGVVALNLILISVFSAKLIDVFGVASNAGNVFFACLFVATYMILERDGRQGGIRTIWFGLVVVLLFDVIAHMVVAMPGLGESADINTALSTIFSAEVRVRGASIVAFVFAQYLNVMVFMAVRERTGPRKLWLRVIIAAAAAQTLDTLLFFSLGFADLSAPTLVQTIVSGWVIKMAIIVMAIPLIYVSTRKGKK